MDIYLYVSREKLEFKGWLLFRSTPRIHLSALPHGGLVLHAVLTHYQGLYSATKVSLFMFYVDIQNTRETAR